MARAWRLAPCVYLAVRRAVPSAICQPTVKTGLSAVDGSWKTMATSRPRISRSCASLTLMTLLPSDQRPRPGLMAVSGSRPRIVLAVTVLPEPDSPTMARTSPASHLRG